VIALLLMSILLLLINISRLYQAFGIICVILQNGKCTQVFAKAFYFNGKGNLVLWTKVPKYI
jgi:hypothetical protein